MKAFLRSLTCFLLAAALGFGLAACGVKGDLEQPPPRDQDKQKESSATFDGDLNVV